MNAFGVCSSMKPPSVAFALSTNASTRREGGKFRAGEGSIWRPRVWATVVSPCEGVVPSCFSRPWCFLMRSTTEVKESSLLLLCQGKGLGLVPLLFPWGVRPEACLLRGRGGHQFGGGVGLGTGGAGAFPTVRESEVFRERPDESPS